MAKNVFIDKDCINHHNTHAVTYGRWGFQQYPSWDTLNREDNQMTIPVSPMPNEIWSEDFTVPVTGMPDISKIEETLRTTDKLADPGQLWLITIRWNGNDVVLPLIATDIVDGPTGPIVTCQYDTRPALLRPGRQYTPETDNTALVYGELSLIRVGEESWQLHVVYEVIFSM